MARELCSTSRVAELQRHLDADHQQNDDLDVEMNGNSGNMGDYTPSGLCLVPSSDVFSIAQFLRRTRTFKGTNSETS
jgi:hypothetical protein